MNPQQTKTVCAHCGKEAKTKEVCATCNGRGWIARSSFGGDPSKGTGWGNSWTETCPECDGKSRWI